MDIFGNTKTELMPKHFFRGAIHVDYKNAVKANVDKQNYSVCPRFWYADATIRCECCNENFTFSKEEQKVWYEEYNFWVDSFPKKCPPCKNLDKELYNEINYVRTQWFKPGKKDKVRENLDKIIEKYGFVPYYWQDLELKLRA